MQSTDKNNAVPNMQADILALAAKLKADMDVDYVYLRYAELLYEKAGLELHLEDSQAAFAKLQKNHTELQTGFVTSMNGLREAHDTHIRQCQAENKALLKEVEERYAIEFNAEVVADFAKKAIEPHLKEVTIEAHIQGQKDAGKARAKVAAHKSHKEDYEIKGQAFKWFDLNANQYKGSLDDCAQAFTRIEPIKFSTARTWLTQWRNANKVAKI